MPKSKTAPAKKKKFFTVEEANRMLPLVRAIVSDIARLAEDLEQRQERLNRIRPGRKAGSGDAYDEECQQMQHELAKDAARMEEFVDELRRLGVELKGWDGLVDFPCWQEDREVCLCWKLGEPAVAHWHELNVGFRGRKKLLATVEK